MIRAYLKDRWWSLAAVAGLSTLVVLAQPPYWKVVLVGMLVLFPLSYLGYAARPNWRKPVTPRQPVLITLGAVGASLLLIGKRLEFVGHSHVIRGLSLGTFLLGCVLMIVSFILLGEESEVS